MQFDAKTSLAIGVGMNATLSGTTPAVGNIIDTQGYGSMVFSAITGTVANAGAADGFTLKLQDSDTTADADFADVTSDFHTGTLSVTDDGADNAPVGMIGYVGYRRYVRLVATGTTGTDATVSSVAVLCHKGYEPGADTVANITAT